MRRTVMFLVVLVVGFPLVARSQSTGTFLGVVKDTSGAVVPGATVTIRSLATDLTRTVTTGDDGAYRFPALLAGQYELQVEKSGFNTVKQTGLTLDVAQENVVNFALQVGTSQQEVTVTGEAPLVNTTSSSTGGLVNEDKMSDLPLNGRNYVDLALQQPGVQQDFLPIGGGGGVTGVFFSSNGSTIRSNNFTIDGASMLNQGGGSTSSEAGTTLGVDGIKEYKVVTHSFSAEYGLVMGSQVLIVSKGGSNQWSGDAFEYLRNSAMDARNFFDYGFVLPGGPRLPEFQRNNFGGSFGGPIRKDKTFFFAVYEGLRQNLGETILDNLPPLACHQLVAKGSGGNPMAPVTLDLGSANQPLFPGGAALANPGLCASSGLNNNSVVPDVIQAWLGQYPLPNLPNNQYTYPATSTVRVDFGQIRVDQNFSESDSFFARYTVDDGFLLNAWGNIPILSTVTALPQFSTAAGSRNQFLTLAENHIFSPTVLNQIRVSASRTTSYVNNIVNTTPLNPQGILSGPAAPAEDLYTMMPGEPIGAFSIGGGITGWGSNGTYPVLHEYNVYSLSDDIFWTRGRHALKFGTLFNIYNSSDKTLLTRQGSISFPNMAGFMTGIPTSYNAVVAYPPSTFANTNWTWLWKTIGVYAQDDFRATSRLTLNMGLRYEIMPSAPHELDGRESAIRDMAYTLIRPQ